MRTSRKLVLCLAAGLCIVLFVWLMVPMTTAAVPSITMESGYLWPGQREVIEERAVQWLQHFQATGEISDQALSVRIVSRGGSDDRNTVWFAVQRSDGDTLAIIRTSWHLDQDGALQLVGEVIGVSPAERRRVVQSTIAELQTRFQTEPEVLRSELIQGLIDDGYRERVVELLYEVLAWDGYDSQLWEVHEGDKGHRASMTLYEPLVLKNVTLSFDVDGSILSISFSAH